MEWVEILSPIAAVITAIVGWYLAESIRGKNKAEAVKTLTDSAMALVNAHEVEILALKSDQALMKMYIIYLLSGIAKLTAQIKEPPCFVPMSLEEFEEMKNPQPK